MIRTIVIDDEKPSREALCNYLNDFCSDIELVSSASSVKTGYKAILKSEPDLVFLDIEMADGKGFDLLGMFEKIKFKVIFVTAYSEYAIKAFRVSAVDYLLKPVKVDELQSAVEKVRVSLSARNNNQSDFSVLFKNLSESTNNKDVISVSHLKGFDVLHINEIIMCSADGYCTNFFLTGKRKIVSSKNLKNYADVLCRHDFLRVHHSYLINPEYVKSYSNQGEILMSENLKASLGDKYKKEFFSRFRQ